MKQAVNKGSDHEVVRGHFDLGTSPNVHRYYCLVDAKTGRKEPNAVLGEPIPAAGGMTSIKGSSVSLYSCSDAEKQNLIVTAGYVLATIPANTVTASSPAPAATQVAAAPPLAVVAVPQAIESSTRSAEKVNVAGVRLGMSPDEVRAVLRAKQLANYSESLEALGHVRAANTRFINVIAAWTQQPDGEAYEIMFTPVPGRERAMAIVHSVGYAPMNAVRETALRDALVKKYGGFATASELPISPTWRVQGSGEVQVGDLCNRRAIVGGLRGAEGGKSARPNLALNTSLDEFQFQVDHCGVAIVTEDHSAANEAAPLNDRVISRFTVTAYSPSIALEGATLSAKPIQTQGVGADPLTPNL